MTDKISYVFSVIGLAISAHAIALPGDLGDLKDNVVIYAGKFNQVFCPSYTKYDCTRWPTNLFRMEYEDVCFTSDNYSCRLTCSGMLTVDRFKLLRFFVLESLSGVKKGYATMVRCPDQY